jgi:hypothetical protein
MGNNTSKIELQKLRMQRDAKFEEIISSLARELGLPLDSAEDRERLIDEAEELTDKWAVAESDNRALELSSALQIRLSEHQDICKQILQYIDFNSSDEESDP